MTTYVLAGYETTAFITQTALHLVVPDGTAVNFTYDVVNTQSGMIPQVDLHLPPYYALTNGSGDDLSTLDTWVGQVGWGDSGQFSTTVLIFGTAVLGEEDYIFALDGDPLPLTAAAMRANFYDFIVSLGPVTSGTFAPQTQISYLDITGMTQDQADTLTGIGTTQDVFSGGLGDDSLDGGSGDDRLTGGSGADAISSGSGTDYLYGDQFEAGLTGDVAGAVYRLYQATLDRAPDPGGYSGWSQAIFEGDMTLTEAAAGFVGSAEFQATYGALSNEDFITLLYNNVLNRAPDAGGLAGWTGALDDASLTRAEVVLGFSQSPEFRTNTGAEATAFAAAHTPAVWSDDVFRLYQATLNRAPDAAGLDYWSGQLGSGTMDFLTAVSGFVGSAEFQANYGALSNGDFVTLLYNNVLNRAPDPGGYAGWTGALDDATLTRQEVVQGFAQSPEFIANTTPDLITWMGDQGVQDVLTGDGGDNHMMGGAMSDVFTFTSTAPSTNTIYDFEAWDILSFSDFGYATANDAITHFTQSGAHAIFTDQGVTVTMLNTQVSALTDDHFLLV